MTRIRRCHEFDIMDEDMRPQDERLDGSTLTFDTREHGGEFSDQMPQAIYVTDRQGRWCTYIPVTVGGRIVRSYSLSYRELHDREGPEVVSSEFDLTHATVKGRYDDDRG